MNSTARDMHTDAPAAPITGRWGRMALLVVAVVLLLSALEATQLLVRASLEGWTITVASVVTRIVSSWMVLVVLSLLVWQFALRVPVSPWSPRVLGIHLAAMVAFALLHVSGMTLALGAIDPRHDVTQTMSFLAATYGVLDILLYALIVGMANSWRYARVAAQRAMAAAQLAEALQRSQLDVLRRQLRR